MFIQSQTTDVEVISDDVSRNLAAAICDVEGLSGVLESGRGLRAKKNVIALGSEKISE